MSLFYDLAICIFHMLARPVQVVVNPAQPAHDRYLYALLGSQMAPNVAYEPPELKDPLCDLYALKIGSSFASFSRSQRVILCFLSQVRLHFAL